MYSTLNNEVRDSTVYYIIISYIILDKQTNWARAKPKGAGGIIYAELGNATKNRPMVPPPSITEQSVVYSDIKAPTDPNKVSH